MFDPMSLTEMRRYQGAQEIPEGFHSFWDKKIQELNGLPKYEFIEKDYFGDQIQAYECWFTGTNEGEVFAKCLFPKSSHPVPVLFYFHGYQGQGPDWSEFLNYVAAGYGVVCLDVRGQAGRSIDNQSFKGITVKGQVIRGMEEGPDALFFKDVYLDIYQLIEIIASLAFVDGTRLYTYGASQGGALALIGAALNPRIQLCVAIYPFLSDFKRILELGDQAEAYNELFRYFKFKDPFHETEEQILEHLSYIDVKNFASRIQGKVKMIVGLQDDVCPPSTQFAIYNRLETEKEVKIMPEYGHEAMHVKVNDLVFNWLTGSRIEI